MGTLKLILYIVIIGISIYSWISYSARRSASKTAHQNLLNGTPLRSLTPREKECIKPFLAVAGKPGQFHELINENVYKLSGEFVSHSLSTQGSETMHELIGDVQVVLPYDAKDFLFEHNEAEVVLTRDFAVVLILNEDFDITKAFERTLHNQAEQRKWEAGTPTIPSALGQNTAFETEPARTIDPFENGDGENNDYDGDLLINEAENEEARLNSPLNTQVFTLGQRDESAGEIAARTPYSYGWIESIGVLMAFILLWIASSSEDNYLGFALASIPFLLLALWRFLRPEKTPRPERVNLAEGPLISMLVKNPTNAAQITGQYFLGETIPLTIPKHWEAHISHYLGQSTEAQIRVSDNALLKIGRELSIDMEETRFPARSTHWSRPLLLSLVGALSLLISLMLIDNLAKDFAYAKAGLFNDKPVEINDYQQALAAPPALGSLVKITAEARCQVLVPKEGSNGVVMPDTVPPINCGTVRWGGNELKVENVSLPEGLASLDNGSALAAERDYASEAIVNMLYMRSLGSGYPAYPSSRDFYLLNNLSRLAMTVDKFCAANLPETQKPCDTFKETLLKSVFEDTPFKGEANWKELIDSAKITAIRKVPMRKAQIDTLRELMQKMIAPQIKTLFSEPFLQLMQSQQGGVLLKLPEEIAAQLASQLSLQTEGWVVANPQSVEEKATSWSSQWAAYQKLSAPENLFPVSLEGLVVQNGKNAAGEIMLSIDTSVNIDQYHRALLRLIMLAGALLLTACSVPMFILRAKLARDRTQAIKAHYERRNPDFI